MEIQGVNVASSQGLEQVSEKRGVAHFAAVAVAMQEALAEVTDEFASYEVQKIASVKFYPSVWESEFDVLLENGTHWIVRGYNGTPRVGDEVKYVRFEEGSRRWNQGFAEGMEFNGARFGKLRNGGWPMELPN